MDSDGIPEYLGGPNRTPLGEDHGPWDDYEIVDGTKKDDIVGIRKKGEGPDGMIFTI